jgi:hypothetical protein
VRRAVSGTAGRLEQPKPPLELPFFLSNFACKDVAKLQMQGPKLFEGHHFKIIARHRRVPFRKREATESRGQVLPRSGRASAAVTQHRRNGLPANNANIQGPPAPFLIRRRSDPFNRPGRSRRNPRRKTKVSRRLSRTHLFDYKSRMLDKFTTFAAWLALGFIAFGTVSPIQNRPSLVTSSSVEHLAAFTVLGVLFCLAYPRQMALVCVIVIGSAVLLEYAQLLTPDRHGRIKDAVEKVAGGVVGIVVGRAIIYIANQRFSK